MVMVCGLKLLGSKCDCKVSLKTDFVPTILWFKIILQWVLKPKQSLRTIPLKANNTSNHEKELHVMEAKRRKTRATRTQLVIVLLFLFGKWSKFFLNTVIIKRCKKKKKKETEVKRTRLYNQKALYSYTLRFAGLIARGSAWKLYINLWHLFYWMTGWLISELPLAETSEISTSFGIPASGNHSFHIHRNAPSPEFGYFM